ncbi:MAG: hypothetical protein ACI9VI_001905 [Candidatus Azotimanducaceae bacterium]|jgi:hypothetical protein
MLEHKYDKEKLEKQLMSVNVRSVLISFFALATFLWVSITIDAHNDTILFGCAVIIGIEAAIALIFKAVFERERVLKIDDNGLLTLTGTGLCGTTIEKDCRKLNEIRRTSKGKTVFVWLVFSSRSRLLFTYSDFSESTALDSISDYVGNFVDK